MWREGLDSLVIDPEEDMARASVSRHSFPAVDGNSWNAQSMPSPNRRPKADNLIDEILAGGADASDPIVVHAKLIRLELLNVKGDLEPEPAKLVLNCTACGMEVHWVQGVTCPIQGTGATASQRRTVSLPSRSFDGGE